MGSLMIGQPLEHLRVNVLAVFRQLFRDFLLSALSFGELFVDRQPPAKQPENQRNTPKAIPESRFLGNLLTLGDVSDPVMTSRGQPEAERKRGLPDERCRLRRRLFRESGNPRKTGVLVATRQLTLCKPGEGPMVAVVGDVYRFLATGDQTNGAYAMWEAIVPPGSGPPPHTHSREEESFLVLEGEITFEVNSRQIVAPAGTFANMPVGSLHRFKNESQQTARMLISIAPAGLEKMFLDVGRPIAFGDPAPPPSQEDIEKLLAVAPTYGLTIEVPRPSEDQVHGASE